MVMKICLPVIAIALQLCVPSMTQAASGTIRFVGSIVEPTHCKVTEFGAAAPTKPQASCFTREGKLAPATEHMVKVSVSDSPLAASAEAGTIHPSRVVTLEYR
jgi:hypothetical protein